MSFREDILPDLQQVRDILVDLGLRRFQVWTRKITWSGSRVGIGTPTTVDAYLGRVKVSELKSKDVVAGTSMSEQHLVLGPFTPEHNAGLWLADTKALSPNDLSPPQNGTPTEIYFVIKGPGFPADGLLFERVSDALDRSFRYMVTVKNTGRSAA